MSTILLTDEEIYQEGLLTEADCSEIERLHKSYGDDIFYGDNDSERHSFAIDVVIAHKRAKAQLKKVAEHLKNLPTDGHDKWYWYHQDLAKALLKEIDGE